MLPLQKIARPALILGLLCLWLVGAAPAQTPDKAIEPFRISIERLNDAYRGDTVHMGITNQLAAENMYGFDFLIGYDTAILSLVDIEAGELFDDSGTYCWEYFESRSDISIECDTGWCPSGLIRAVGVADINDGDHHPLDLSPENGTELCALNFYVKADTIINDFFVTPVRFYWMDCGDNSIAVDMPPTIGLAMSDKVYDWNGSVIFDIADSTAGFPGCYGAPNSCLVDSTTTVRFINFYNGGVEIDNNDSRGDINRNSIPNEIADWVMYANFFMYGLEVFAPYYEPSIYASDVNADGIALSIEDLVYLYRIICGDAQPFPAPAADKSAGDTLIIMQDLATKTVSVDYGDTLAALYLIFEGDITPQPLLDTARHFCGYRYDGTHTFVLIHPNMMNGGECRKGFTEGPVFSYSGFGRLIKWEQSSYRITGAADYNDNLFSFINPFVQIQILITGDYDGQASVFPQPLPRFMARIGESETLSIIIWDFAEHDVLDIDLPSLRVNDTIVPLSTVLLPPPPGYEDPALEIIVSARSFISSYYFGPDTTGMPFPWAEIFDTLSTRLFTYQVSGDFTDALSFNTLGDVTIFDRPVTIPVPSGWETIGGALDAAQAGDTVLVACDTYYEHNISMKDSVCLRSETGNRGCAVIDADSLGRVMIIESAGRATTITGFTFREGYAPGYPPDGYGGGVFCREASPVFRNCAFVDNAATDGGGLGCIQGSNPILEDCLIANNAAGDAGGGMLCMAGANAELQECIISGNQAAQLGGGIMSLSSSTPSLTDCLLAFNSAGSGGGMFHDGFASSQTLRLTGCTFAYNTGADNGSALTFSLSSPLVENCLIAFNHVSEAVSCIDEQTHPVLQCSDIYGNEGGDWTAYIADQLGASGNISLDPMFCDTIWIDFHLDGLSPCSPLNNICQTLIGAYGVNCGIRCGDINISSQVDVGDIVFIIAHLFRSGPAPVFPNIADLNGNGEVDVGDAVVLINFIFKNGPSLECQPE